MKKWNMVIDLARCHDCNDCFLADKDEFVGNDFPPYSVAQPWSGHRWMNIERKERGQYPIVQVCYLPTPCMHCDDAPCIKDSPKRHHLEARGRPGHHRSREGQGPSGDRRYLPLRLHLLERGSPSGPEVHRVASISSTTAGPRPAARRSAPLRPSSSSWPTTPRWPRWSPPRASRSCIPSSAPSPGSTTRTSIGGRRCSPPAAWRTRTPTNAPKAPR